MYWQESLTRTRRLYSQKPILESQYFSERVCSMSSVLSE